MFPVVAPVVAFWAAFDVAVPGAVVELCAVFMFVVVVLLHIGEGSGQQFLRVLAR